MYAFHKQAVVDKLQVITSSIIGRSFYCVVHCTIEVKQESFDAVVGKMNRRHSLQELCN